MELRQWAELILSANNLEDKLFSPELLTDHEPGEALFWKEPNRPAGMHFQRHTRKQKLPSLHQFHNPFNRAICLHRFAGHELLAVEVMAWALLAFPKAPPSFRKGLAQTLREEQGHVQLYTQRLAELGVSFGDLPLYKHFWSYLPYFRCPLHYLSTMSLTFEMANLDFAPYYGYCFAKWGDDASAALMQRIFKDECRHVSFGYHWLKRLKPDALTEWETWLELLPQPLSPRRAKGISFKEEGRRRAGLPDSWIESLKRL
jgi:uncharacterized ferritin-like protein (DUF455 family)